MSILLIIFEKLKWFGYFFIKKFSIIIYYYFTCLIFQEDKQSHYHHELYTDNLGICNPSSILPLPHNEGFPFQINSYDDVDEPIFNPEIHLQLEMPEYVRVLPDFEEMKTTPVINCEQNGSRFAYSAPFQV